jgi:hypothetical protein
MRTLQFLQTSFSFYGAFLILKFIWYEDIKKKELILSACQREFRSEIGYHGSPLVWCISVINYYAGMFLNEWLLVSKDADRE